MHEFKENDLVHYHPIIGGPHDGNEYRIRRVGDLPGNRKVAWLVAKAGCVALEALSLVEEGEQKK
ncbi:hypothetical protein DSLASN_01810 [Desulfoluna limicola]|uniref:Uncharacterized protein n=1 Tax=Desulfoluna limicola TaxID=2810562 RepID=A0ABM7PBH1_9BACT|nr:hypothetical protein [Desulfoluna limicola]BCS94549.1 hypothetical protein DSLASN_01810 [Desulfoluna limicola]